MTFTLPEWTRLICYLVSVVAVAFLALRAYQRREWPAVMAWLGLGMLFGWFVFDLTLASMGLSTRETRSFSTPILIFVTGALVVLARGEMRRQRYETRLRREIREIDRLIVSERESG